MEKMKVAVPTNDKETLAERTGRAKGFLIFEIENKSAKEIDFRVNPHKHDDDESEEHDHSHAEVMEVLSDCNYIIVNKVGKHFKHDLNQTNIAVFKTRSKEIQAALDSFLSEL